MRARPHAFTPIDAVWLYLDRPTSTTLIAGLLLFSEPVDFARLRNQIEDRLLRFDRFIQHPRPPVLPLTLPTWVPDSDFDLDAHIHRSALAPPGEWPQLQTFVEQLLARPLPHNQPLWQMHLIEHYGSGSALAIIFSHVIADGFASMHLLDAITDLAPAAQRLPPAEDVPLTFADRLAAALDTVDSALRLPGALLHGALDLTRDPQRIVGEAVYRAQELQALAKYVLLWPDRRTALHSRGSHRKRVASSDPLPLSEVKAVGSALNGTVNDVIACAVSGAFRRYLLGRGERVEGLTLHAAVPYNLRQPEQSSELGNGFSIVFLPLPVGLADPIERLEAVKGDMDFIKGHPEAPTSFLVTSAMGFLPVPLCRLGCDFFMGKVTAVVTNVRGLPEPRYMAGSHIERIMFWAPTSSYRSVGVSILSYADCVTVNFSSDAAAVPDLETIVDGFEAEMGELRSRTEEAGRTPV